MSDLVLISNPATKEEGFPPLGLAYIASYLEKNSDFSVKIIDKEKNIVKSVVRENPMLVGITSVTVKFNNAINLTKKIKSVIDVPVLIGGVHVTTLPNSLPKEFDLGVIGEGEKTILELMNVFSKSNNPKKIDGIVYHRGSDIVQTQRRKLIEPLDSIPHPSRHLFKMEKYLAPRKIVSKVKFSRGTHMFTSRGCPFNCVYCSSSCFWQRKIRFHSPEYVIGEMTHLIEKYKVDTLCIFDDLFIASKKRLERIVELIRENKINEQVLFRCSARSSLIDGNTAKLMKKMNIGTVTIGFESGSQKILSYLKKNTTKLEDNKRAAKLLHKYGIEIEGLFMIGSPGETKQDMMMTLDFIKKGFVDTMQLSITTPFPGTELWDYALKKNLITEDMDWDVLDQLPNKDLSDYIILDDAISMEDFKEIHQLFMKEQNQMNYGIDIKARDIFSRHLIKRSLQDPKKAFNHLYYSIKKRVRK